MGRAAQGIAPGHGVKADYFRILDVPQLSIAINISYRAKLDQPERSTGHSFPESRVIHAVHAPKVSHLPRQEIDVLSEQTVQESDAEVTDGEGSVTPGARGGCPEAPGRVLGERRSG